jgi:hypothetical protein
MGGRGLNASARLGVKAGEVGDTSVSISRSSDVGGLVPSCGLGCLNLLLDWACRQLQNRSSLPGDEIGKQNDCTVREFQRVVMLGWLVDIYLAKSRQSIADVLAKHHAVSLNVMLECDLGPGTKADRDLRTIRAGKTPSRRRLESGRNQRFRDFSGTCCDRM